MQKSGYLVLKILPIETFIEKYWSSVLGPKILSDPSKITFLTHFQHKFSAFINKKCEFKQFFHLHYLACKIQIILLLLC